MMFNFYKVVMFWDIILLFTLIKFSDKLFPMVCIILTPTRLLTLHISFISYERNYVGIS